jgi:hypothetical protein
MTGSKHKVYVSNLVAYVGTVLQQHIAGYKWNKPIPPAENEEGRAAYYNELFHENCNWIEDQLQRVMPHVELPQDQAIPDWMLEKIRREQQYAMNAADEEDSMKEVSKDDKKREDD